MIKEIIFMDKAQAKLKVSRFAPPVTLNEFYAAILINDPFEESIAVSQLIKPVLRLECNCSIFSRRYLFDRTMAERVISFLDHIESSDSNFCIFIQSKRGLHRSAAIAKLVKAVKKDAVKVTGLVQPLDLCGNPDPVVMSLLTAEWSKKIGEDARKYVKG